MQPARIAVGLGSRQCSVPADSDHRRLCSTVRTGVKASVLRLPDGTWTGSRNCLPELFHCAHGDCRLTLMVRLNTGKSWSPAVFLINQCPTARPRIIVRHGTACTQAAGPAGQPSSSNTYVYRQLMQCACT